MIVWLWAACAEPTEPDPGGPLLDVAAWEFGAASDPFGDHRPADAVCDSGTTLEGGTLEVDTGVCTWLWATQPALRDVPGPARLELVFWHAVLLADEPAEAHLAVTLDGELAYETFVEIPHDPDATTVQFPAPGPAPAGAEIGLHLHNHGANTWNVLRLDVLPEPVPL